MSDEERFNFTNELLHALAELLGACRAVGMG